MPATDDQERVLAELEILLHAIRAARDEPERTAPDVAAPGSGRPTGTGPVTRIQTAPPRSDAAAQGGDAFTHALNGGPAPGHVSLPADATEESALDRRAPHTPVRRLAAIAAALVVGALLLVWALDRPENSPAPPAAPQRAEQVPSTDPPLPPPGDAVQRIEPHKVRIELSTLRRVWLRVTVDGRLVMEREAGAGERIPFGGDRSIMVRAGDAGAVLVRAGGGEQAALGRDGQVLTRAFPASAP